MLNPEQYADFETAEEIVATEKARKIQAGKREEGTLPEEENNSTEEMTIGHAIDAIEQGIEYLELEELDGLVQPEMTGAIVRKLLLERLRERQDEVMAYSCAEEHDANKLERIAGFLILDLTALTNLKSGFDKLSGKEEEQEAPAIKPSTNTLANHMAAQEVRRRLMEPRMRQLYWGM